jgi:nitroreductase
VQLSYRISHIWLIGVLPYDTELSGEWLPIGGSMNPSLKWNIEAPMKFTKEELSAVEKAVAARRTFKVIGDVAKPVSFDAEFDERCRDLVRAAVRAADAAPFHYDRNFDGVAQPWRVDILWHDSCHKVAGNFYQWFDNVKPGNKLPGMLSACGACVVVSWLPQFEGLQNQDTFSSGEALPAKAKQIQIDQEHLAATSAYVQNLLLLLTASNMGTYWSSGGQFRDDTMKEKIGVEKSGIVLAAVFVDFFGGGAGQRDAANSSQGSPERIPGKLANKRAPMERWVSEVRI